MLQNRSISFIFLFIFTKLIYDALENLKKSLILVKTVEVRNNNLNNNFEMDAILEFC